MSTTTKGDTFEERSTSQRVITAVAEETGNDLTEVGPLYHVIDPDALDRLFAATHGNSRSQGYIKFTFAGCNVVVHGSGEVEVTEQELATEVTDGPDTEAHRVETDGMR